MRFKYHGSQAVSEAKVRVALTLSASEGDRQRERESERERHAQAPNRWEAREQLVPFVKLKKWI